MVTPPAHSARQGAGVLGSTAFQTWVIAPVLTCTAAGTSFVQPVWWHRKGIFLKAVEAVGLSLNPSNKYIREDCACK